MINHVTKSPADLDGGIEGDLVVVDEAVLPVVLRALLLLLGLQHGIHISW